jgi:hypothetical protein
MSNIKEDFLNTIKSSKPDIKTAELVETKDNIPANTNDKESLTKVTREELISSLKNTKQISSDILEHLTDILYSQYPDSDTITETSNIIDKIIKIDKTLYEISGMKTKDETSKEILVKNSQDYLKNLIRNAEKIKDGETNA